MFFEFGMIIDVSLSECNISAPDICLILNFNFHIDHLNMDEMATLLIFLQPKLIHSSHIISKIII